MFDINNLSLEDLYSLKSWLSSMSTSDVKKEINKVIRKRKAEQKKCPLNKKFTLDFMLQWGILSREEVNLLRNNAINNLYELLNCDLDNIVGLNSEMKRHIDHERRFYDLSRYADESVSSKPIKK